MARGLLAALLTIDARRAAAERGAWWSAAARLLGAGGGLARGFVRWAHAAAGLASDLVLLLTPLLWSLLDPSRCQLLGEPPADVPAVAAWHSLVEELAKWLGPLLMACGSLSDEAKEQLPFLLTVLLLPCLREAGSGEHGSIGLLAALRGDLIVPLPALCSAAPRLMQLSGLAAALSAAPEAGPAAAALAAALANTVLATTAPGDGARRMVTDALQQHGPSPAPDASTPARALLLAAAAGSRLEDGEWDSGPTHRARAKVRLAVALGAALERAPPAEWVSWRTALAGKARRALRWLLAPPGLACAEEAVAERVSAARLLICCARLAGRADCAALGRGVGRDPQAPEAGDPSLLLESIPSASWAAECLVRAMPSEAMDLISVVDLLRALVARDRGALALLAYHCAGPAVARRLQDAARVDGQTLACCASFAAGLARLLETACAREVLQLVRAVESRCSVDGAAPDGVLPCLLCAVAVLEMRARDGSAGALLVASRTLQQAALAGLAGPACVEAGLAEAAYAMVAVALLSAEAGGEMLRSPTPLTPSPRRAPSAGALRGAVVAITIEAGADAWLSALRYVERPRLQAAAALALCAICLAEPSAAKGCLPAGCLPELLRVAVGHLSHGEPRLRAASLLLITASLSVRHVPLRARIFLFNTIAGASQQRSLEALVVEAGAGAGAEDPLLSTAVLVYLWLVAKARPLWFRPRAALPAASELVRCVATRDAGSGLQRLAALHAAEALLAAAGAAEVPPELAGARAALAALVGSAPNWRAARAAAAADHHPLSEGGPAAPWPDRAPPALFEALAFQLCGLLLAPQSAEESGRARCGGQAALKRPWAAR